MHSEVRRHLSALFDSQDGQKDSMSSSAAKGSESHTRRYEALLSMAKAMSVCNDCGSAEDVLTKELCRVVSFDYLHLVTFHNATRVVSWELLHLDGKTVDVSDRDGFLRDAPTDWVHESQEVVASADWRQEQRFPKYREFL